jgi:hypothetical protein
VASKESALSKIGADGFPVTFATLEITASVVTLFALADNFT